MSIAAHFRAKMDVALASSDATRGQGDDARRTALYQALQAGDQFVMGRSEIIALMDAAAGKEQPPIRGPVAVIGTKALDEARAALRGAIAALGDCANLSLALHGLDAAAGEPPTDIAPLAAVREGAGK